MLLAEQMSCGWDPGTQKTNSLPRNHCLCIQTADPVNFDVDASWRGEQGRHAAANRGSRGNGLCTAEMQPRLHPSTPLHLLSLSDYNHAVRHRGRVPPACPAVRSARRCHWPRRRSTRCGPAVGRRSTDWSRAPSAVPDSCRKVAQSAGRNP